jgi:hypothetical protein
MFKIKIECRIAGQALRLAKSINAFHSFPQF